MIRKTVTIDDKLFDTLEKSQIISQYNSFSEMVSNALRLLIKQRKKEEYKKALLKASKDKLFLQDIKEIEEDFKYADFEQQNKAV